MTEHDFNSNFYIKHGHLLCLSYTYWTGRKLLAKNLLPGSLIKTLYYAPFAIVSHDTQADPVFNFGNKTALHLFELEWDHFLKLPSRESVEMIKRDEREKLMQRVTTDGYIDNYSGIRVSSSGKRFLINDATIWNIVDADGVYHGQAAAFENWTYL